MLLCSTRAAFELLAAPIAGLATEELRVAHLDRDRRLLGIGRHAGHGGSVAVPLRAIVRDALAVDAAGMVIAHNHPSGDPTPSDADLAVTRRIAGTMRLLGIRLFDHLIVAAGGCRSLREMGLI